MIEIGGEKRPVKFNFNALEELDEVHGVNFLDQESIKKLKPLKIGKAVAYVGLKYGLDETGEKPVPFTIGQVGAWLKPGDINKFFKVLNNGEKKDDAEPGEPVGDSSKEQPTGA